MGADPLRVLLISGTLTPMPCGVGDYTAHLADALGRLPGVTAGVLTSAAAGDGAASSTFEVLPVVRSWNAASLRSLFSAVRRWKPSVVHMQFPSQAYGAHYGPWLVPAAIALQRVPVVQTWHEYYPAGSGWRNILNAITPGGLVVVRPNYLEQMPGWYRRLVSRKLFRMIPSAAALPAVRLSDAERQALRARLGVKSRRLIAYFGFVYPAKGVETVFSIASATEDRVVLIGELKPDDPYHQEVSRRIATAEWRDHVVTTGFLPEADAAAILAAADAVVLPFVDGGGLWNTSIQAASKQGTFVLTTSRERQGYDSELNTFYAKPGDIEAMRRALREYSGRRVERSADTGAQEWEGIAEAHRRVYEQVLGRPA